MLPSSPLEAVDWLLSLSKRQFDKSRDANQHRSGWGTSRVLDWKVGGRFVVTSENAVRERRKAEFCRFDGIHISGLSLVEKEKQI